MGLVPGGFGSNRVLTPNRCVVHTGAMVDNSEIISGIYRHPFKDAALLNLRNDVVQYTDHGAGYAGPGDSGAGVCAGNVMVGIHVGGGDRNSGFGLLTGSVRPWIQNTSGIAPS